MGDVDPWADKIIDALRQADAPMFARRSFFYALAGRGYLKHDGIDKALADLVHSGRLVATSYGFGFRFPLRELPPPPPGATPE